ncbi:MAG: ABC transporter permease [Bacteroidales bacterium]|nr:ABC transporter permease [Bacteroidales bacterium]
MRTILHIIRKEFIQVFRNKTMLPIIFILPIIQMIVLVYAATLEMKNIDVIVVDKDLSATSKRLISKFEGSPFFFLEDFTFSLEEAENKMKGGKADLIIHIPVNFEQQLFRESEVKIQLLTNAINSMEAGLINAYSSYLLTDFNQRLIAENINLAAPVRFSKIDVKYRYWYNPELDYKIYMVPGILVILVTIIGMFLSALNIVREKEMGTIEQINVTPIKKYQFIIGKTIPFWIIALFELAFGLTIGKILFDLPIEGSLVLLFGFAGVYLLVAMGMGLLISTMANTQQQVMFIIFFFMLTFIMMSGIFTSVESMPDWACYVNKINPYAYFMRVIRMVLLKGSGFWDISKEFFSLLIYGSLLLSLAVWRYRKVS